ncbi:MAG: hypothetical protein ACPGYV_05365 [Phycisphaeraceae bacterium]
MLYSHKTRVGTFYIGQSEDGRFHPIFNDESLGSYHKDWQAAEDLAMNVTFSVMHPTTGELLDTSALGIPEHPSEWTRVSNSR